MQDSGKNGAEDQFSQVVRARQLDLRPAAITTLQLNITRLCNQACLHCHVDASPRRREMMSQTVIDQCLAILAKYPSIQNVDITGGAPELHPGFKSLVTKSRALKRHVMVRHNLTVAQDPHPLSKENMGYLPEFFAANAVEVISSLPYHQEYFTDKQRGEGVFKKSIATLKRLNELGYGRADGPLKLNLVYNPVGPFLPAAQDSLEADYKKSLKEQFGITFNSLYVLTNMPINRFKAQLKKLATYEDYMDKLIAAFNPSAAEGVMCRSLISVGYDGRLFDCDFNQMLDLPLHAPKPLTVFDFDEGMLLSRQIRFDAHCFGCTAGAGSSCGGATTDTKD